MRCWHKDLIKLLPKQQLCGQWRECCLIAKQITENGNPNHILVNRIMDYPLNHFITYSKMIWKEMCHRKYKCSWEKFQNYIFPAAIREARYYVLDEVDKNLLFCNWHNETYLRQCLYNLEEKAICNGISYDEWKPIYDKYKNKYELWGKIDLWKERN